MGNDVALKEESALVSISDAMKADAGSGFENVTQEDVALPFLSLIQSLSPQRTKGDPKWIEGAEEGLLFNTVSESLYDYVSIVPCAYNKVFMEWVPRDHGGGLVGIYDRTEVNHRIESKDGLKITSVAGNDIVPTMQFFCVQVDEDAKIILDRFLISMSISQIKVGKKWLSRMQTIMAPGETPYPVPMYGQVWKMSSCLEKNASGQPYYNWSPSFERPLDDTAVYLACKQFHFDVVGGEAKVDYGKSDIGEDDLPF